LAKLGHAGKNEVEVVVILAQTTSFARCPLEFSGHGIVYY